MKKSLLTLGAAALALTGMAATPMQMKTSAPSLDRSQALQTEVKGLNLGHATSNRMMKVVNPDASSADVITSAEGTVQKMTTIGSGYYVYWFWILNYENQEVANEVVYGEDGDVYFYDLIPNAATDAYVKGTLADGKVTLPMGQVILFDDDYGYGFQLSVLDYVEYEDEEGELIMTYEPNDEVESVTFAVAEDGSMVLDSLEEGQMLGLTYTDDNAWAGYGAYELSLVPFDKEQVALPEDYEAVPDFWTMTADGYGWNVTWSQGGEDVYFQGLSNQMPEAWVKGGLKIVDDTTAIISIAQDQYVGDIMGYRIFTKAAKLVWENGELVDGELMPEDYVYELVWDFENMTITPKDPEVALLYNAATDRIYYLQILENFKLIQQDGLAGGTPATPYDLYFQDTLEAYGYSGFFFTIPILNTEGELMDSDKIYYEVFVDGELYEFYPEEYGTEEVLTQVPFNLSLYYIYQVSATGREVDFFMEGINEAYLGVQSIYKDGDEETRSEYVEINAAEGSKVVAVGDKKVASVKYYGLDGREVANPAEGIYIQRMTFEDGTVATLKKVVR